MNCERFREMVHDVARDEALDSAALQDALEHAESCSECDALLVEAENLSLGLRALADRFTSAAAPDRVESALLLALRQNKRSHLPKVRSRNLGSWVLATSAGIAAIVLFGLVLVRSHGRSPIVAADQSAPARIASAPPAGHSSEAFDDPNASASADSDSVLDASDDWPLTYEGTTEATGFIPLTQAFDPAALDSSSIVRVALSNPALRNLGLYLDDVQSNGTVVADLAVSSDGTPEAIRVVRW
jgi:hypothetical protein